MNNPAFNFDAGAHTRKTTQQEKYTASSHTEGSLGEILTQLPDKMKEELGVTDADLSEATTEEGWEILRKLVMHPIVGALIAEKVMESPMWIPETVKSLTITDDKHGVRLTCPFTEPYGGVNQVTMHYEEIPRVIAALQEAYDMLDPHTFHDLTLDMEVPDWAEEDDGEMYVTRDKFEQDLRQFADGFRLLGADDEVIGKVNKDIDRYIDEAFKDRVKAPISEMIVVTERLLAEMEEDLS